MDFGIFDHVDRNGAALADLYEQRLQLLGLYEACGFWGYHVAEHHGTPLGMAPSPSVYLASAIQRTQRIHIGPLVYLLPLYNPLRLIEEICMLHNLSRGRLQVGVGRGISPFELGFFGRNPDDAKEVFGEALAIVQSGLREDRLSFKGRHFAFDNVPMELKPYKNAPPSLWMGATSIETAALAGKSGINIVGLMPAEAMASRVTAFREAAGTRAADLKVGLSFLIVVGKDDRAARERAARAYATWHKSFHHLYTLHGRAPVLAAWPESFEALAQQKRAVAGSPARVRDFIEEVCATSGINYLTAQMMFGDLPFEAARESIELFGSDVMPYFRT